MQITTKYLTADLLSEKLGGRSRTAIYADIKLGRLPRPIKLGGRSYWIETEVDDRLAQAPRGVPSAEAS